MVSSSATIQPAAGSTSNPPLGKWKPVSTGSIVWAAYRKRGVTVVLGVLCILAGGLLALMVPKFTGLAVDSVKQLGNLSEFRAMDAMSRVAESLAGLDASVTGESRLHRCLAAMAVATLVLGVLQFLKRYQLIGLSRHVEFDLRQGLFRHMQVLPLPVFTRMRSGDIMTRSTSDIEAVRMMVGPAMMYMTDVVVLLPLALGAMFLTSPVLAAWSLVPLVLLTVSTLLFSPRTRIYSEQVQARQSDLGARAQENFSGARVVKAFGREEFEAREFDALGKRLLDSQLALARNRSAYQSLIWVLNGVGLLVFLYFGARQIAAGALSVGQFVEFNLYFVMLYWPMISLGWVIMLVVRGRVSARRINELFGEAPDPGVAFDPFAEVPPDEPRLRGEAEFRGVTFAYEPGKPVLSGLSFHVKPGHTIAIVGPVGCGKTTVAQLLMRLREADGGGIFIDGRDIREIDPGLLRRQVGYVPQETFLFSESIRDNVAFGLGGRDPAAGDGAGFVEAAASVAQLSGEVESLPDKYETLLGERGVNLSGGQKQRAAIARALAIRPAIMILDDCLSAVDTRTEAAILSGLKRELADTTVVIIAQRVSTVSHASEILVLDRGVVVERGTDAELRARGGLYAAMAESQEMRESLQDA